MRLTLLISATALLTSGIASATAVPPVCGTTAAGGTATTLQDYITDYASTGCTVSDKTFSGFSYSNSGLTLTASNVTVIPLGSNPNNPGLEFQAAWSVGAGQTMDSEIGFNVRVTNGLALIDDDSLAVPSFFVGTGASAFVTENVCLGGTFVNGTCTGGTLQNPTLHLDQSGQNTLHVGPFGPFVSLGVLKDIGLNGGTGSANFSEVFQNFSEVPVPEPFSLLLLGTSILAIAPLLKKRLG